MTAPPDAARLLASLPLVVILLSPGLVIASANPAAEQFLGQSAKRLVDKTLREFVTFDDPQLADRLDDSDALLTARQTSVAVAGRGRRELDVNLAPIIEMPGWQVLTLLESINSDAAGDADSALRAPDILAHEIKNPLAGIRGAAQLLGRKLQDSDRALTTLIADEVDRIAKLIDQMQSLSQRTHTELGPCNLHSGIRQAIAILAAQGSGDRIEEEFDPSLPPVHGNEDALMQVMINLIANAREACSTVLRPRVVVRTRFASGLQLHPAGSGKGLRLPIEVRVSDNGPGIDPTIREHIFEPFVTSKKSGQGLGLALVRKLARDMSGHIAHERDEEAGWTHFRLHLALDNPAQSIRKTRGATA